MKYKRITVETDKMGGMPCIRGLRIPVATIVGMVANGMTAKKIRQAYPDLKAEDIREALLYATEAVKEMQIAVNDPSHLYHYTSHQGLLGILGGQQISIRATGIGHLNDPTEFQYAHNLLKRCLAESGILKSGKHDRLQKKLESVMSYFSGDAFFVFCLSEKDNLLSQWLSYCPQGGYSIGFSRSLLSSSVAAYRGRLKRCVYDPEEQKRQVEDKIRRLVSDFDKKENVQPDAFIENLVVLWYLDWLELATLLKDEAFKAEREWRVIVDMEQVEAGISNNSTGGIGATCKPQGGFRSGKWGVIPYRELKLSYPGEPCPVERIVVGPNSYQDMAKAGVDALLKKRGLDKKIVVDASGIPFRYI